MHQHRKQTYGYQRGRSMHTQLLLTLHDPMDCSPPGSSVYGISQQYCGVGCHFLLQRIFLTQELNLYLLLDRRILYR